MTKLRFDAILYYKLGSENSDEGHIKCSRGPQDSHPCLKLTDKLSYNFSLLAPWITSSSWMH